MAPLIRKLLASIGLGLSLASFASAAAPNVYLTIPAKIEANSKITIQVMIRFDEAINALEGNLRFDERFLAVDSFSDASAVVPLWVQPPQLAGAGWIKFAGVIPGGVEPAIYNEAKVFEVVFKTLKAGSTTLFLDGLKVYLNQAVPKEVALAVHSFPVRIEPAGLHPETREALVLDFEPPEPFPIYLISNPEINNGKHTIVFNAQDKATGVDYYEVNEQFLGLFGSWQKVDSPFLLSHQSLLSIIKVRAVDKVGRERIEIYISVRVVYLVTVVIIGTILALGLIIVKYLLPRLVRIKFFE